MVGRAVSSLRDRERASIAAFLREHGDLFRDAHVLDFGCGQQPYRAIVEEFGAEEYVGFDSDLYPGNVAGPSDYEAFPDLFNARVDPGFDVVICTQVIQYVECPVELVHRIYSMIRAGGKMLMTGPTNWPIVEREDLWRMTAAGIDYFLSARDQFESVTTGYRDCELVAEGETLPTGWWAVATV